MKRSLPVVAVAAMGLLAAGLTGMAPAAAAPPTSSGDPADSLAVYTGRIATSQLAQVHALGVDRHEVVVEDVAAPGSKSRQVEVEVILSGKEADRLAGQGVVLERKSSDSADTFRIQAEEDPEVFDTYLGEGGILEELQQTAEEHPLITELVTIGQSVQGTDIVAVRVTANADTVDQGSRPSTLYVGAQHAREWITPEMVRRLLQHVVGSYGSDERITRLVNETEMWFLPVANPDGYDYTFTEGNRLWRKNLRDNNGNGVIDAEDGVDLNRNFPTRWGYDNEGSSPVPSSQTYRGPAPGSEPENQALMDLGERVGFEFLVNYHSAAELILYGLGWQVATPSPDDIIYEALAGDDANSAVPGYDPDLSAELYTTNGDTDTHFQAAYGTLGFTPEMSTCEYISDLYPDDEWEADDCESGFNFPDDEELIQEEFEKNIPFALAVAESALDPDDPVSVVGRDTPDFVVDSFEVSYGDPQTVAVWAKRALKGLRVHYSVNGGPPRMRPVQEWRGGERYGDENTDYYAEYRGVIRGAEPGDTVEVWFGAGVGSTLSLSERFTYTVAQDTGNQVLVLANEDYTGVNPDYDDSVTEPQYAAAHVAAVEAAGYSADVWDVDAQGVPHDLGVLGHYDAVLWYLGDNRITQDEEDFYTEVGSTGQVEDLSVAERQQYLTIAVRDYLNEGGKLIHSGETAQYYGPNDLSVGGLYYGLNGDPTAPCAITTSYYDDCLIMANDFRQYWLGAYERVSAGTPTGVTGPGGNTVPLRGTASNPLDEAGQFSVTSDVLPVEDFPQFASQGVAEYIGAGGENPFEPVEGDYLVGVRHDDSTYTRLTRTVDLSGVAAGDAPALELQMSVDIEPEYDFVIVEAHTVGQDDWTTLPENNGATTTDPPAECAADGFLLEMHPWLAHYLGGDDCTEPGTSGEWNAILYSSEGWEDFSYDLSEFAGSEVEVSVTYVTDPAFGGLGVSVDDTRITAGGSVLEAEGFESGLGAWSVMGAPEGSPSTTAEWVRGEQVIEIWAGVATPDTLLLGFGLEQVATDEARAAIVRMGLRGLMRQP